MLDLDNLHSLQVQVLLKYFHNFDHYYLKNSDYLRNPKNFDHLHNYKNSDLHNLKNSHLRRLDFHNWSNFNKNIRINCTKIFLKKNLYYLQTYLIFLIFIFIVNFIYVNF